MSKNLILDYEQVNDKLKVICEKYEAIIKQDDLAVTKYGLPISYYTIGNGNKDIVITGATHGAELVTTDFMLRLMEEMGKKPEDFCLDEYRFHIIPMLNPEGYLITSSAVRTKIPRDMDIEDAESICKEYYLAYRSDDREAIARRKEKIEPDRISLKKYQRMFSDVDYTCISDKYSNIRESVKNIYSKYPDLPKGSIITWDANADGIDIQANSLYNYFDMLKKDVQKDSVLNIDDNNVNENKEIIYDNLAFRDAINNMHRYGSLRYENIETSHPGPMNCGMDPEVGFYETIETKTISNLLEKLYNRGTLAGYNNYHSTGGVIYHRPSYGGNGVMISDDLYWQKIINNVCLASLYKNDTYKNLSDVEKSRYGLVNGDSSGPTTTNDIFRMKYPADLLIELSGMGGNPIAPYGDIDGNYMNLMNSNIEAFKGYIKNYDIVKKVAEYLYKSIESTLLKFKGKVDDEETTNEVIKLIYEKAEEMMVEVNSLIKNKGIQDIYVKEKSGISR